MKVTITTTEEFEYDYEKVKKTFAKELADNLADGRTERNFMEESFGELLSRSTGNDHVTNGLLIRQTDSDIEYEFGS